MKKNEIKFRFNDEDFVKSSWSKNNPQTCVEIAMNEKFVGVRDSKNPTQQQLLFSHDEWNAFIKGVKGLEFDLK